MIRISWTIQIRFLGLECIDRHHLDDIEFVAAVFALDESRRDAENL